MQCKLLFFSFLCGNFNLILIKMNYKTKRKLVILADIICWVALLFFGFKYFTGC